MSRPRRLIAWVASAATPIATIARSAVGQRPDRGQELVGTAAIHDPQHGVAALGQPQRPLAPVLGLLVALDEPPPDEPVDQPARRRRRAADRLGQLADRERAAVGEDVQRRELGEPEPQLPELAGEADDQLAPERPAHRHALADLADVRQPVAGREDRRGQVRLEAAGDRAGGGWTGRRARPGSFFTHDRKRTETRRCVQPCMVVALRAVVARVGFDACSHLAFVCPGQGSQAVGMGRALAEASPAAAASSPPPIRPSANRSARSPGTARPSAST